MIWLGFDMDVTDKFGRGVIIVTSNDNRANISGRTAMKGMMPTEIIEKGFGAVFNTQKEFFDTIQERNRDWQVRLD
jgi:hypothetical protein